MVLVMVVVDIEIMIDAEIVDDILDPIEIEKIIVKIAVPGMVEIGENAKIRTKDRDTEEGKEEVMADIGKIVINNNDRF